jgi:hypothetical protein
MHAFVRAVIFAVVLSGPFLAGFPPAAAADSPVVAIVATDGYADLKKQLGWVGARVGNPQLPALAESFVMMATQFKGLAGLDVNRPAGVIVTAAGDMPVVHGYVPVKDLDKLLGVLQGITGPVDQAGGKKLVRMPGGPPLEIEERDGWAIIAPQGSPAGPANPEQLIAQVAEAFTIGAKLFPSAMPQGMREQLEAAAQQGVEAAAAQGQAIDAAGMNAALEGLKETEALFFGLTIDPANDRGFVETRTVLLPGSAGATVWSDAGKADNALGLPAPADGKPATIRGHHAQAVPPAARAAIEATLAQALPAGSGDAITDALFGLVQDLVGAMLDAGGLEAGLAVDTTAVTADDLLPAVTLAARIKDGPGLERQVKKRFAEKGSLPPEATITFDAGTEAGATLHELAIDISRTPAADRLGDTLEATLAVTPDRAYLLLGGDVPKRLAAAVAAGKATDPKSKPLTGLDIAVPGMMAFAGKLATAGGDPAGAVLADVAAESADKASAVVQLLVRPIERGVAMRLSADAGAIEAIAAAVTRQVQGGGAIGPAGGGLPVPLGGNAPALAP